MIKLKKMFALQIRYFKKNEERDAKYEKLYKILFTKQYSLRQK